MNPLGLVMPSDEAAFGDASALPKIAIVIPAYRVTRQIEQVIAGLPDWAWRIYVVDDACPDGSGEVARAVADERLLIIRHPENLGVGGAVVSGYRAALADGADVLVKMDGDGQMDPTMLPQLLGPILTGEADYTKGNRFYDLARLSSMPRVRLFGNAILSFMTKLSAGYWDIFDPTNGYTALHASVARQLSLEKLSRRYFFETDLLFRLNTIRAVVIDVPMDARYADESSNLRAWRVAPDFLIKHVRNGMKRVFYNYFLRDLSLASIQLAMGAVFLTVGGGLGLQYWYRSDISGVPTLAGSVTLVAMLVIIGIQMLLGFLAYDIASVPKRPLHRLLKPAGLQ